MRMAVDQAWISVLAEQGGNGVAVCIHDFGVLAGLCCFTLSAYVGDELLAGSKGLAEELLLVCRRADLLAKRLVAYVIGAQAVAMTQQHGLCAEVNQ